MAEINLLNIKMLTGYRYHDVTGFQVTTAWNIFLLMTVDINASNEMNRHATSAESWMDVIKLYMEIDLYDKFVYLNSAPKKRIYLY